MILDGIGENGLQILYMSSGQYIFLVKLRYNGDSQQIVFNQLLTMLSTLSIEKWTGSRRRLYRLQFGAPRPDCQVN